MTADAPPPDGPPDDALPAGPSPDETRPDETPLAESSPDGPPPDDAPPAGPGPAAPPPDATPLTGPSPDATLLDAAPQAGSLPAEGWRGWDVYAPFYDWENRQTIGRRDVRFWAGLARRAEGTVLELGCGTGRLAVPVARAARRFVGIDRSAPMLRRARTRLRRARLAGRAVLVRGDMRALPFRRRWRCRLVMAPYGLFQSLLSDDDLTAALAGAARVLPRGGRLGVDLAPGLPRWDEYHRHVSLRGPMAGGRRITLIETVRQIRPRGMTVFDQEFVEWRGNRRTVHRCSIAFRTIPVPRMAARIEAAGFRIDAVLGDYQGAPWSPAADVQVLLATRIG